MFTITLSDVKNLGTKAIKIAATTIFICLVLNQLSYDKDELENETRIQTIQQS